MKSIQIAPSDSTVLLIDLDNCPRQIAKLPQTLLEFSRVIACYGGVEPKVPLKLVTLLATAINEGKLEIVGMQKKGKNAADFGLAFWAGRLVNEMPPETDFLILSQDADLDHVVNLLQSADRKAVRIDGKTHNIQIVGTTAPVQEPDELMNGIGLLNMDVVEEYCLQALQPDKPRPAKKTTLQNSIKAFFKSRKEIKPQEILQELIKREIINIDDKGRVTYNNAALSLQSSLDFNRDDEPLPF